MLHIYKYRFFILFFITITTCLLLFSVTLAETQPINLYLKISDGQDIKFNPRSTQFAMINDQIAAFSLINGKISVNTQTADGNWEECAILGPKELTINAFHVKDIDGDNLPEIIMGTVDPGLIFIYKMINGQWESINYGKYVWSSISSITTGQFSAATGMDFLIQNQDGFLFLFHKTETSLDLIWKSPNTWRPIQSFFAVDIDNDSKDEIIATYQNGGIAILKLINNAIVSIWENYPWGKIMAVSYSDWDNDGRPDIVFSTSQKLIYVLGWTENGYCFKEQNSNFNYIVENFSFINAPNISERKLLITTDTAGKIHLLEYNKTEKRWREIISVNLERICKIINFDNGNFLFLSNKNLCYFSSLISLSSFKISYLEQEYEIKPMLACQNNNIYISPKTLLFPELKCTFIENKNSSLWLIDDKTYELSKTVPCIIKLNGNKFERINDVILIDNELYMPISTYKRLFNLPLTIDFKKKTLVLN